MRLIAEKIPWCNENILTIDDDEKNSEKISFHRKKYDIFPLAEISWSLLFMK